MTFDVKPKTKGIWDRVKQSVRQKQVSDDEVGGLVPACSFGRRNKCKRRVWETSTLLDVKSYHSVARAAHGKQWDSLSEDVKKILRPVSLFEREDGMMVDGATGRPYHNELKTYAYCIVDSSGRVKRNVVNQISRKAQAKQLEREMLEIFRVVKNDDGSSRLFFFDRDFGAWFWFDNLSGVPTYLPHKLQIMILKNGLNIYQVFGYLRSKGVVLSDNWMQTGLYNPTVHSASKKQINQIGA